MHHRARPIGVLRFAPVPTRARRLAAALVVLAGLATPACATTSVSLRQGPREYVAADYQEVLRTWTRSASLITLSELDDLLTVTATFESWDFRWAYVVRYAQDYRLTVSQRKRLLDTALDETRKRHQFYVALYSGNARWSDLTRADTAWIVRLIDDVGNETAPEEIISIRRPGAIERTYFPYTSVWRQAFRIRFPVATADGRPTISPKAKWFGLRFAGAQGNEELRWRISNDTDTDSTAAASY